MRVRPSGPTNEPLLAIVGEAPGQEEEREGRPFVGSSGFLLNQMLNQCGIDRNSIFITNVADIRPPSNDFSYFYDDKKRTKVSLELAQHRERLWKELREVKPKVVIAMGAEALKSLCPEAGTITNYRGTMLETMNGMRVLPTLHPAFLLRGNYHLKPVVETDIKKALRQAKNPFIPVLHFNTNPSFDECMDFLSSTPPFTAFDIETFGEHTRRFGFATSPTDAISIPLIWRGTHRWTEVEEEMLLLAMDKFLRNEEIKKYIQNFPFDNTIIAKELGLHVEGVYLDTMFAHHLLYPELPKGLDFLSSLHTDFPMYWGKDRHGADETNATYNCYDCCATFIVAEEVERMLKKRGMWDFYLSIIHPANFALARMQNRGIKIDLAARGVYAKRAEEKLVELQASLDKLCYPGLNADSPKQVKALLYETWKLPVKRKRGKSKSITVDDDALKALIKRFPVYAEAMKTILAFRETRTFLSTFCNALVSRDEKIRTSYNLAGTVTGRISSSKSLDGTGGNLQNIPRRVDPNRPKISDGFRKVFVSDSGKVLIKADLKQAEYMCVTWFAPIPEFVKEYSTNPSFDIHRRNASDIWKIKQEEVTKKQRDDSKNGVYAGNYGMGAMKASELYDMEFKDAKYIIEEYHKARPEIKQWWEKIKNEINTTRTISNPLGRQRIFMGRVDDELYRSAYSHKCQSTVADIILRAIGLLDAQGVELLLQVHDELVCQCKDSLEEVSRVVLLLKEAMEYPIKIQGIEYPLLIPAEITVGKSWGETIPFEEWRTQNAPRQILEEVSTT